MLNSLIAYNNAFKIGNSLFKLFSLISFFLAILGLFIVDEPKLIITCILYNLFFCYIYSLKEVRNIPGMILLVITNFLFVQIPVVFMCYKGIDNNFGAFIATSNGNNYYYSFLFSGLIFFLLAYIFTLIGLIVGRKIKFRQDNQNKMFKKAQTIAPWMILGFTTFYLIMKDNASIFLARADGTEKQESILAILFNDKTYQMVFSVLFYLIPHKSVRKSTIYFITIVLLFLLLGISSTSKGAILQIFTFFFLGPLAYFYKSQNEILWPRNKLFIAAIILAVPLFLYSMVSRSIMGLGIDLTIDNIFELILNSGDFDVKIILDLIFERLSAMINNFILLYSTYSTNYNLEYSLHFLNYTFSSLLNLILPGTPFPDSYVLTSQLFPNALDQLTLESGLDRVTLLKQANTQPYSLFGVLIIIFSPYPSLIFCFLIGSLFSIGFNFFKSHPMKIIVMYSFTGFFQAYAIEAVIQYYIITIITTLILVGSLRIFDRIKT